MTDYVKTVNFTAKDSLTSGDPNKVVRGSEIDTEFANVAIAVATKSEPNSTETLTNKTLNLSSNTLTGTIAQFNTAVSDADLATTGANTFTGNQNGGDNNLVRWDLIDFGYVYFNSGTTNALNYENGSHQRWTPNTGAQTLSITNWPPSGNLGELLIEGVNLGAATITWPTINWVTSTGATTTTFSSNGVTLQTSGTDFCLLWTRDAGTTIYGKFVR